MKILILYIFISVFFLTNVYAEQFDTSTIAYSQQYNYKNPKFEKKYNLYYFTLNYLSFAYERWDTLSSKSNIILRMVQFDNFGPEIILTDNNFLNTDPAVSHSMVVWVSNQNSNLDLFYSNYNGISWSPGQALQKTPQYEFTPDITEYNSSPLNPGYYIVCMRDGDIYLKTYYQGGFLLDSNLTSNVNEACSSPKVRIFKDKLFITYLKSVNGIKRIVLTKANIDANYTLNNFNTTDIVQNGSAAGINFSNGFANFPSNGGFINYNYDTLGSTHTMGINLDNYSDKSVITENYEGNNLNGTGSILEIVTDNAASYYFTVFGWLRKSNDSSMIIANSYFNDSFQWGVSKSFYLGDSTVNSNFDISNYFPNYSINAYRFRLVWEREINNRTSLVEARFDDKLSSINIGNTFAGNFKLEQNYPNPFNPSTVIRYSLAVNRFVTLTVYDVLGNEISTLVNQNQIAGFYSVDFNGSNISSGIYFYKLQSDNFTEVKKMTLLK